jgi:hypothetical protein
MKYQDVFVCNTSEPNVRAAIEGWTFEQPEEVDLTYKMLRKERNPKYPSHNYVPVGLIASGNRYNTLYTTVLHALGDGWRLLAPPQEHTETNAEGYPYKVYEWWLVRDCE